jgi:hypothetical protein
MRRSGVPDVSVNRLRQDFDKIFGVHNYTCDLIRYVDAQAGDFFDESGSSTKVTHKIKISLQGTNDDINRLSQGIEPPKGVIECYVKNDVNLKSEDLILFSNRYFKINNLKDGIKNGETIFQQFNLEYTTMRAP